MSDATSLPTNVGFTDADIIKDSKRGQYAEGWFQWYVTDAIRKVNEKSNNLIVLLTTQALTKPDDGSSVHKLKNWHNLVLPLRNNEVDGHDKPNTLWVCEPFLRAILGESEVPERPEKVEGVFYFAGQPIDGSEVDAKNEEVTRRIYQICRELWVEGPDKLKNCAFYAEGFDNYDEKTKRTYFNLNHETVSGALPDDASLVDPGERGEGFER